MWTIPLLVTSFHDCLSHITLTPFSYNNHGDVLWFRCSIFLKILLTFFAKHYINFYIKNVIVINWYGLTKVVCEFMLASYNSIPCLTKFLWFISNLHPFNRKNILQFGYRYIPGVYICTDKHNTHTKLILRNVFNNSHHTHTKIENANLK